MDRQLTPLLGSFGVILYYQPCMHLHEEIKFL